MTLRLEQPWWFIGLAICIPIAWLAWRWFAAMSTARRWSAIFFRCLLVSLLLAMLAGVSMVRRIDRVAVVACVDVSGSVHRLANPDALGHESDGSPRSYQSAVRAFLASHTASRRPDDLAGVVLFGATPTAASTTSRGSGSSGFAIPDAWPPTEEATDIEHALRLAAAMIPPDAAGRILLVSDGVQTQGSALAFASGLSAQGTDVRGRRSSIRIDVVPIEHAVTSEVMVESIDSPPTAQSGATIAVRVVLSATARCTGILQLTREEQPVDINGREPGSALRLTLEPGRTVEVFNVPLPEGRIHRFAAIWSPDVDASGRMIGDTIASNNRAESVTVAPGRGAVLIVDGVSGGAPQGAGAILGNTLRAAGLEVQTTASEGLRSDLLYLQQFDLIVLQNVAAEAVPASAHAALVTSVTQLGVGLIMVGGPDSFGAGGWKGTSIEPILPVKLDLPEQLLSPAAAVMLVIDNSGSMNRSVMGSNRSQQDIADEGAARAVESMDKTDLVGVITFNSSYTVDVPLGPNVDAKGTAKRIRGIGADGGTNMPPALREAHRQLRSAKADVKHVIVLSDGVSQGHEAIPGIIEEMAADGIQVSSIAIGNEADVEGMRDIARAGKGQFYRVIDPMLLPRVLLKAVRMVRSPLVREGVFAPVQLPTGSPILEGVDRAFGGQIAPLGGLLLTQARTDPTVVYPLVAPRSRDKPGGGEPVLGYWNAGLGRVAAFTSDAHEKWAGAWLTTNDGAGYARFWTQLARAIARPPTGRTQELTSEIDGDRMVIRLRSTEDSGRPIDGLLIPGSVYSPGGGKRDLVLSQVGPGEYEQVIPLASIPARDGERGADTEAVSASYVITLAPRRRAGDSNAAVLPPVIGGVTRAPGAEFRTLQSDRATLKAIADATGGRVLELSATGTTSPAERTKFDLFTREGMTPVESRSPLWPLLAVAAVVMMLLDVATRRVAWDRLFNSELRGVVGREALVALRDRASLASAATSRLKAAAHEPDADAPGAVPAAGPLGEEDAEQVREQERARRREQRRAASAALRPEEGSSGSQEVPLGSPPPGPTSEVDAHGGLAAAKRRARDRMNDQ